MISIYCGDNSVASRNAYATEKSTLAHKGSLFITISPADIDIIIKSGGSDAHDLFAGAPIYETTNLIPALRKLYTRKAKEKIREISTSTSIQLLDWEEKSAYDLSIDKDKFPFVHEYKMPESTFSILPSFVPGSKVTFLKKLSTLSQYQPIEVTFTMLMRHVRLMMILANGKNAKDSPYLVRLAQSSLAKWKPEMLMIIYKYLLSIDINVKTGRNTPLSLKEQVNILVSMVL